MIGKVGTYGLPWYLVGITSGSSARDHDDHDAATTPNVPVTSLPADLPENVIPLRPITVVPASTEAARADAGTLVDADTAAKPSPIFGRAAVNLPEWPTVLVFTALAVSMMVLLLDSFRRGALLFGASMALAFFFRAVLTDHEAGLLKVRSRKVDLAILGLFALSITLLAFWVPAPS